MGFVIVGATFQTSAFTVPHLIVGRVITGMGTGIKTSTVPMYQAELCDRAIRGRLISAETLFVGVGIVFAYWFDFGMSFAGGAIAWRLPIAFQLIFSIFIVVLVYGLPESPRWLCHRGDEREALDTLCAVFDKSADDPYIVAEMNSMKHAIPLEAEIEGKRSIVNLFAKRDRIDTRYRMLLAWGMQFMNQAGGINLVVYFAPSVLVQNVGLSSRLALILGGCIQMMFMFGALLPTFMLDRMGRRKTMMWGCGGLGISMLMIAALLSQSERPGNGESYASASVTFFFLYMLIFGASVNCVPWVYVPEILPLHARAQGTAVGISSNWLWNFVVVMITPVIINRLGWQAYLIFMATNLAFVPTIYFFYPETSNLGLEEIDHIFTDGGNPVKVAKHMQSGLAMRRASIGAATERTGLPQLYTQKADMSDEKLEST